MSRRARPSLHGDERGNLFFEYLLITFFGAFFLLWFFAPITGSAMILEHASRRNVLYSTIP